MAVQPDRRTAILLSASPHYLGETMRALILICSALIWISACSAGHGATIDYDRTIVLDAERLAEGGVKSAYDAEIAVELRARSIQPKPLIEEKDDNVPAYSVQFGEKHFPIYGPGLAPEESWGRATYALFEAVNRQLLGTDFRFYALGGGHELQGVFLTEDEAAQAKRELSNKSDWPYIPTGSPPDWGEPGGGES
jgi:hypothetical protein